MNNKTIIEFEELLRSRRVLSEEAVDTQPHSIIVNYFVTKSIVFFITVYKTFYQIKNLLALIISKKCYNFDVAKIAKSKHNNKQITSYFKEMVM